MFRSYRRRSLCGIAIAVIVVVAIWIPEKEMSVRSAWSSRGKMRSRGNTASSRQKGSRNFGNCWAVSYDGKRKGLLMFWKNVRSQVIYRLISVPFRGFKH